MTDKFVDLVDGRHTLKTPIASSAGAADADKIPRTGPDGKLHMSLQAPETYVHNQMVPATTWVVNHNLGKYPSITVHDPSGTELTTRVEHVSINQALVIMSFALSGTAHAN